MPPQSGLDKFLNDPFWSIKWLNPDYWFNLFYKFLHALFPYIFRADNVDGFKFFLTTLCIFFMIIICYCTVRMLEIRKKEHEHLHHEILEYAHHQAEKKQKHESAGGVSKNERWNKVLQLIYSTNQADWKLAIIEADSMLDALMDQLGFTGDTLGDKLKMATQDTFPGLTDAWEVHTIRNRIAHEGVAFEVSSHEAKRVIALYEQIFLPFGYI